MNWDHPEHSEWKEQREGPHVRSWVVAMPLVQKQIDGHPLTRAEREYLDRFYRSSLCQEFFCRLNIPFANNSQCWTDGIPTEEQCHRCATHYLATNVVEFAQEDAINIADGHAIVALHAIKKDDTGIITFEWKDNTGAPRVGLTGEYIPGIQLHRKASLEQVYPVCLPSLSPSFKGGCDKECARCPAHGYYDSVRETTHTGLGTVKLVNATLPPHIADGLKKLAAAFQEDSHAERTNPTGNPSAPEPPAEPA